MPEERDLQIIVSIKIFVMWHIIKLLFYKIAITILQLLKSILSGA